MDDTERLRGWRSWVDPEAKPEDWDRNLWSELFALLHRRDMWRGYRDALEASPKDARESARYLTQWILRNHIETQALAIRRIADRSPNPKTISLGRLLDDIAAHLHVLGIDPADASSDADRLAEAASRVRRFANKVVAHLDDDHAPASQGVSLGDIDGGVDLCAALWERWYRAVTGKGVLVELPSLGWSSVVRLHRRDLAIDNPGALGARIFHFLGEAAARELLEALERDPEERAALIGRLYGRKNARWIAKIMIDIEEDPQDLVRLRLIDALRRGLGYSG